MLAVVPLMMLGLLAAACLVSSADWRGSGSISLLGAGEEAAAAHAITTAAAIDPDSVTAKNPPVDEKIMKEGEKAEKDGVWSNTEVVALSKRLGFAFAVQNSQQIFKVCSWTDTKK